jgi:hypothetical protein
MTIAGVRQRIHAGRRRRHLEATDGTIVIAVEKKRESNAADADRRSDGARARLAAAAASAKNASDRHVSVAVSLRAVERNQRVAATLEP